MKKSLIWLPVICALLYTAASAQGPLLWVSNIADQDAIMEYRSKNRPNSKWSEAFKAQEKRQIALNGDEPYIVTHRLPNEKTVQWKVYTRWNVYLKKIAEKGIEWDLDFTFHEDNQGRNIQVMSATLISPQGEKIKLFDQPDDDTTSKFIRNVINKRWATVRKAPDGNIDNVDLDFRGRKLSFSSERFRGELQQMCIGEDQDSCQIIGRWWIKAGREGDVFFSVSKQSPNQITGYCTLDGDQLVNGELPRYSWKSR